MYIDDLFTLLEIKKRFNIIQKYIIFILLKIYQNFIIIYLI